MERQKILSVIFMMATNLVNIDTKDLNKIVSNFRRKLRKEINRIHKNENSLFLKSQANAINAWQVAVDKLEREDIKLTVSTMLLSLNSFIDEEKYTNKFYTQNTLSDVLNSIKHNSNIGLENDLLVEQGSNRLVDELAKALDITSSRKLILKRKITIARQNIIIEKG